MTTINAPKCIACRHFIGLIGNPTCKAFPDKIPDEIWLDEFDHRKPFPGDRGIRFEEKNH